MGKPRWPGCVLAHRVAWSVAHGDPADGLHVLHHCDNPACVRPSHLFLGTPADNMHDMVTKRRHGSHKRSDYMPRGTDHHYFERGEKITREKAQEIKEAAGPQKSIALQFGISQSMVSKIKHGHTWR